MNGELAQLIALVSHGNSFLTGTDESNAPDLMRSNSTFQFVDTLKFARYQSRADTVGVEVARTTHDWLGLLHSEQATRLWYIAFAWDQQDLPEHRAGAFIGGVPKAIQVASPKGFELWCPSWTVGDRGNPDRRIWNVEYKSLRFDHSQAMTPDVNAVRPHLAQALEAARAFSEKAGESASSWAMWFTAALRLLEAEDPHPPFHADMLPGIGYGLAARQLLAAATQANVFGGMGSWNDIGFREEPVQAEYEQVTRELYEAVKLSFVAAVNSFDEKLIVQKR